MRPGITMTTSSMRYDFIPDVTAKNEVLSLAISPTLKLAASVWTEKVQDSLITARLACLQHAVEELRDHRPDWVLWFLATQRTVQPDNRITRLRGLWKSLIAAGIDLPQGEFLNESIVATQDGMRTFGALRFELNQLQAVHSTMLVTQAAIAFTPESEGRAKVQLLTEQGWAMRNTKPPEEIVELICDDSGIVIDVYGEFDDCDASVAAFGRKKILIDLK